MRISSTNPGVVLLGLVVGCQPTPTELSTEGPGDSSGPPSTTTSPVEPSTTTTTSPSEDTTAGSSGSTSVGVVSTSSSEGSSGTSSSGSGSESEGESSTGEPVDEPLGPFDPATAVVELNSPASDDDPTLTGDLLEIYFGSTRAGTEDIWRSTRATVGDTWEPPEAVDELNTFSIETFPEVSADGLLILVTSTRGPGGDFDVYWSRRTDRDDDWPELVELSGAASGAQDYGATPSPDLASVFLCREDLPGMGQSDIWQAPADLVAGVVQAPVHVPELASAVADCSVTLSPSQREIFFETTRPGGGAPEWDLWMATRPDADTAWDDPIAVDELNTVVDEVDPWLSPDRRTLFFAGGLPGTYDLYVATRD